MTTEVIVAPDKELTSLFMFEDIRAVQNEDMTLDINIEDAAEVLGLIKITNSNGKEYRNIRLDRINKYSKEYGFSHKWEKGDYIPESFFYWLAFKVENDHAKNFRKCFSIALRDLRIKTYLNNTQKAESRDILLLEENFKATEAILERIVGQTNSITLRGMAKLISSEGKAISERGLKEILKMWNILLKNGKEPTQYALERGICEYSFYKNNKNPVVLITQRGQLFILKKFFRPHVGKNKKDLLVTGLKREQGGSQKL